MLRFLEVETLIQMLEGHVPKTIQQIRIPVYVSSEIVPIQNVDLADLHRDHGRYYVLVFHHQRYLTEVSSILQVTNLEIQRILSKSVTTNRIARRTFTSVPVEL